MILYRYCREGEEEAVEFRGKGKREKGDRTLILLLFHSLTGADEAFVQCGSLSPAQDVRVRNIPLAS